MTNLGLKPKYPIFTNPKAYCYSLQDSNGDEFYHWLHFNAGMNKRDTESFLRTLFNANLDYANYDNVRYLDFKATKRIPEAGDELLFNLNHNELKVSRKNIPIFDWLMRYMEKVEKRVNLDIAENVTGYGISSEHLDSFVYGTFDSDLQAMDIQFVSLDEAKRFFEDMNTPTAILNITRRMQEDINEAMINYMA
jgi:hypothetical protein